MQSYKDLKNIYNKHLYKTFWPVQSGVHGKRFFRLAKNCGAREKKLRYLFNLPHKTYPMPASHAWQSAEIPHLPN